MFRATRIAVTLALAFLAACPVLTRADDAKKLEDDWKVVSADSGGRVSDKSPGPQLVIIRGDQITLKMKEGEGRTFRFTVDPSQKPKAMDWLKKDGSGIGGIYELDGDDLKICFPLVPSERKDGERLKRPANFDAKENPVIAPDSSPREGALINDFAPLPTRPSI
jgi:uncharacterized protein (TIGR03067 family)